MKPTELYHDDKLLLEGKEVVVTNICRLRPSQDLYKKPGAERYVLTFSNEAGSSSMSVWSDEDVPEASWKMTDTQKEALWKLRRFNLVKGEACMVNIGAPDGNLSPVIASELVAKGWAERGVDSKLFITNKGLEELKQVEDVKGDVLTATRDRKDT
jgi:hypothetical protein